MKRIPFDIDLAKKIQAGEKRGKIVTIIEVPEEEYQFKAFEKVVVRGNGVSVPWKTDFFSHIDKDNLDVHYVCVGGWWSYCLPYTEHTAQLIGTTDKWDGYPDGIL